MTRIEWDILLDEGDLVVENNDLAIGNAYDQNVFHVIAGNKGNYPKNRTIGFGIGEYRNAPLRPGQLQRGIKKELQRAGYTINKVIVRNDGITIV